MKLDTSKNSYTLIYASLLVIVVAFLLAFVSSMLRDKQNSNVEQDTKKQILSALKVPMDNGVEKTYAQYIKQEYLLQKDGTLTPYEGSFVTNFEKEAKENGRLHLFEGEINGEKKYIIPVYGTGLWGAIWGYVALNADKQTVYGTYFSHASETPGLGAEIATINFQNRFIGKKVTDAGDVVLTVAKSGKVTDPTTQVDGITGGTITSQGVDHMLKTVLGDYTEFLNNKQ